MRDIFRAVLKLGSLLVFVASAGWLSAAELSESDKYFLAGYEQLRVALVTDDLAKANQLAESLTNSGIEVSKSETLERARAEFARISEIAIKLTAGQPGYYTVHCPMLNKDWVQTSKQIGNPYTGKRMPECGTIKGSGPPSANSN